MAAAIKHARATLPQFFALARNPKPSMSQFRLKVGLANGDNKEFVWVRPFEKTAEGFTGQLRNDPRSDKRRKFGDLIKFSEQDIADWAYTKDGRMMGNVTTCVVLKRQPKHEADAFKRKYAFECDFDR